ncbi:MAG TPA: hypothetical protein VGD05_08180 [Pyrinomonadaceae bacterium]|jgi:hypothetical protein
MKADEYEKLCNEPNVFSRSDLEIAERILREKNLSVALHISKFLENSPITKSEKHKGDKFTDYFLVALSESDAEIIVDAFLDLEVDNVENDGTTTSLAGFYAGEADKWLNFLTSIKS